jgi:hypothetical protein
MGLMKLPFKGAHEVRPNGATSSAAPIVTSLVALIYSVRPTLDAKAVVKIVEQGCDDIKKGYKIHTGHGRVNFGKSIKAGSGLGQVVISCLQRSGPCCRVECRHFRQAESIVDQLQPMSFR